AFEQLIRFVGRFPLVTHIQQISEEVCTEHARSVGKDTVLAAVSQTLTNLRLIDNVSDTLILRPLISYDKEHIINLARQIGTEDF
ncbi:hypothetical protein MJM28_31010, partial [Salmonella enterica subsp. enterica serovar Montevideo]|nr:hypothetical protein [Salmonella enterica subsp. enterica serovar Montevideo]